ncbi:UNVERIFIED_CONTAM: hypothetical protein PYX00_008817 [Menopon gallinae]|uniref:Dynactin subunit 1 n=1 Tax=Menopon gallinae TaxID=328185 RepID=A0AAW2HPS2_9NEOP
MSESLLKVGCRVQVPAKSVKGTVHYVGNTAFAQGKWIGIVLDEPKGKNNGTVKDKQYFKCEENYGMFLRPSHLVLLDQNDVPVLDLTEEATTPKTRSTTKLSGKPSPQSTLKKPGKSSSRLSLASITSSPSREDLTGSTSSLASQPSSATRRTSSFVETGFVETLKPQFTPGQVMLSPGQPGPSGTNPTAAGGINMAGGSSNVSLLQQEIENLREQLKNLTDKYEALQVKRLQDKEKLKDYDKTKIQLDQMMEFKSKIMEAQAALQRELQLAKKEAREAIEAKNLHADEMADLAETVEMATLDKEMAEEKAESLQLELQEVRDKLEEVTLDYETLKAELEDGGNVEGIPKERVSFEFKQLQQQNARLRETVVKMRDLVAHDKHEYQKLQKDLDQKKSEIAELSRTKEKLSALVETFEEQVADLQEQVDAALGAEELVETLGNDKMTLQEKISELQEEIADLEALKDTNDQLLEAQKEIDIELREELDMALNTIREAQREKEAALENLNDSHKTIQKFRELVSKLQEQIQDLHGKLEAESKKPLAVPEIADFQKIFLETKAHKRAVDLELRQLDLNQKEQHVQFLMAFMPESFMNRGGDHDAILLLLLIPRLLWKCDILLGQINDKFPRVDGIQRKAVVKEDKVVQFACRCRLCYYLYSCQMVLHQFIFSLDTCTAETLLRAAAKYPEIAVQEKIIDSYIEAVKKDRLDENILAEPLEKCLNYLDAIRGIILESESDRLHESHYIKDLCQALISACDSVIIDCQSVQVMVNDTAGNGETYLLVQFISANLEHCLIQVKNIKRKIPTGEIMLNIPRIYLTKLNSSSQNINRIVKTMHEVAKFSRQFILLQGEPDAGMSTAKLEELFLSSADKYIDTEVDENSVTESVRNSITNFVKVVTEFSELIDKSEFDLINSTGEKLPDRPIALRAAAVKKELDETKILSKRLETKDMDIRELKVALKMKQEELSEMLIRKELLEKKLAVINRDHEEEVTKLRRELEEVKETLKRKEKEFDDTMDHLQADIDALDSERGELKEKLKMYSRKPLFDMTPESEYYATAEKSTASSGQIWRSVESDPAMQNEIEQLKNTLKTLSLQYFKQECDLHVKKLRELPSISVCNNTIEEEKESKRILNELWKEGQELRKQVIDGLVFGIIDFSEMKPGQKYEPSSFFSKQYTEKKEIQNRVNSFSAKVMEQLVKKVEGGHIETALKVFPTPEFKKVLTESNPTSIGFLSIPCPKKEAANFAPPLILDLKSLKLVQDKIGNLIS